MPVPPSVMRPCKISLRNLAIRLLKIDLSVNRWSYSHACMEKEYFKDVPEEAQWLPGDMSNMVIGQGYVLVTPIQVVRAYGAVATESSCVRIC